MVGIKPQRCTKVAVESFRGAVGSFRGGLQLFRGTGNCFFGIGQGFRVRREAARYAQSVSG